MENNPKDFIFCVDFSPLSSPWMPKVEIVNHFTGRERKEVAGVNFRCAPCSQSSHCHILPPSGRHCSANPVFLKVKTF